MAQEKIFLGSDFGVINLFNEDGTPLTYPPYVTLHSKATGEYYVADRVVQNQDGVTYDATFTADVTSRMKPILYAIEVYTDSTMVSMVRYINDYAIGTIVAPTPGQVNNSTGGES